MSVRLPSKRDDTPVIADALRGLKRDNAGLVDRMTNIPSLKDADPMAAIEAAGPFVGGIEGGGPKGPRPKVPELLERLRQDPTAVDGVPRNTRMDLSPGTQKTYNDIHFALSGVGDHIHDVPREEFNRLTNAYLVNMAGEHHPAANMPMAEAPPTPPPPPMEPRLGPQSAAPSGEASRLPAPAEGLLSRIIAQLRKEQLDTAALMNRSATPAANEPTPPMEGP